MIILHNLRNICHRRIALNPRLFDIKTVSTSNKKSESTAIHVETPMIIFHNLKNNCHRRMVFNPRLFNIRTVSTSNKKSESTTIHAETPNAKQGESVAPQKHHWRSYGFDDVNEARDYMWAYSTNFFMVFFAFSMCFIFYYYPDYNDNDWVHREAYIELRRREVLGLPIIDPNYVDPATINLPDDGTLGDDDIII